MILKKSIAVYLLFLSVWSYGQLYFPNESFYNSEIERMRLRDSTKQGFYKSHLNMWPMMDYHVTSADSITNSNGKYYYWITQKLFKDNFIVFEGDKFWCAVDPILDLELGIDLALDSTALMYWNTRGLRVQAKFLDKVAFNTVIYETQAVVPQYMADYFDGHGEFFPNSLGSSYTQNNGVVPGYARTKPFKVNGYDFGMAEGQLSIYANKHLNFHLGNGTTFIGRGHRSLLLSDFTTNYPFLKIQTHALKGRLQYTVMYAMHQNLYRLSEYSTPESTYERKIGTYQYLDFSILKNWQIGLFHGSMWNRVDSSGVQKPDYAFLNPVIYSNLAFKGLQGSGYKSIVGLNTNLSLGPVNIYGQLVMDRSTIGGYQFGLKGYDLIIPNLDLRLEYNHVEQNTYLSNEERMNYSHSNLPLAHPLVAGFDELVVRLSYRYKKFFLFNHFVYSARDRNDTENIGTNILATEAIGNPAGFYRNHVMINRIEGGIRLNKKYNLQIYLGHQWRNETQKVSNWLTNYSYAGLRCSLRNTTFDF